MVQHKSALGWLGLVTYVWVWDWYGPESLTKGWWRGLQHPETRLVLIFVWAWVSSHLFFRKPQKILIRW
jgi:hypothetical protein